MHTSWLSKYGSYWGILSTKIKTSLIEDGTNFISTIGNALGFEKIVWVFRLALACFTFGNTRRNCLYMIITLDFLKFWTMWILVKWFTNWLLHYGSYSLMFRKLYQHFSSKITLDFKNMYFHQETNKSKIKYVLLYFLNRICKFRQILLILTINIKQYYFILILRC